MPGGRLDHAVEPLLLDPGLERLHPEAQREVERHRPVLDEQVLVAAAPPAHLGPVAVRLPAVEHPAGRVARRGERGPVRALRLRVAPAAARDRVGHRHEPDRVAGAQLPELPALAGCDDRRAHEPAEARAVGAEQDRHVAGEVDGADRVRGVVDVRRVQARLAAVGARPLRRRSDEPDAGARGVVVDAVLRVEQCGHPGRGQELGRAVRALEDAELPGVDDCGLLGDGQRSARRRRVGLGPERERRRRGAAPAPRGRRTRRA